jgi:hypothetical protein
MPYIASIGTHLPCWVSAVTILEGPANGTG